MPTTCRMDPDEIDYNPFERIPGDDEFRKGVGPVDKWLPTTLDEIVRRPNVPKQIKPLVEFKKVLGPLMLHFVDELSNRVWEIQGQQFQAPDEITQEALEGFRASMVSSGSTYLAVTKQYNAKQGNANVD